MKRWIVAALALALVGAACSQDEPGTLRIYTSVTQGTVDSVVEGFGVLYPDLDVEVFRAPTGELTARIAAEQREGGIRADVLWLTDPLSMQQYAGDGVLASWEPNAAVDLPADYATDTFWGTRILTMVMIATLTLGIGINSAVFTVVNGVFLKPLSYENAEQLTFVWNTTQRGLTLDTTTVNPTDFLDWRSQNSTFADMAAFNIWLPTVANDAGAERVSAGIVTPNFFDVLGVQPVLGAGFNEAHGTAGLNRVVVLSHAFWQRWFGGNPNVLEQSLAVGGQAYDIVGVMPPGYRH